MIGGRHSIYRRLQESIARGISLVRHAHGRRLLAYASLASFASCKTTGPVAVESIDLSQALIQFNNGIQSSSITLIATPRGSRGNALSEVVSFSSADGGVASVTAQNDQSAVVNPTGAGTTTISASSGGVTETVSVQVKAVVRGITLSPNPIPTLLPGTQAVVTATVAADPRVSTDVTWTTTGSAVVSLTTLGSTSVRLTGVAQGTVVLNAQSVEDPSASASLPVVVIDVNSIAVNPPALSIFKTESGQLTATTDPTGVPVTWTSAAPGIATVSSSGLVNGVAVGNTTVLAATPKPGVNVVVPVEVKPRVLNVTCAPSTVNDLWAGTTVQLSSVVTTDEQGNPAVTWSSSSPSVATVSASGVVTGLKKGSASITAQSVGGPTKFGTCAVNVTRDVSAVVVTPVNPTVLAGSTQQLNAAVTADPGVSTALTWTSSNINVATVSATGLVTGVGQGQATITARSVASPGVSGVSDVTVIAVSTVTVAPDAATINVGSQVTLGATVLPPTAPQAVDWSSANPAIASVNPTTGVVTGVSRGTTTITATSQANSMAKGSAAITVRGIISIGIAPGIDSVRVGGLKAFLAAITADPGVSNLATYSSLNPAIATVNPTTGVATGVSLGTTTIRATAQADMTKVANATLKVLSPCDLPIIMSIGQTINAAVNATSCSSGDINLEHEHIAYSLGGNTSFVSTATAPFTYHFAPLVTNKGYWYAAFVAAGPNTWRVFASAGQYRSFISNTALGQFGAISWATAVSIGGFCPGAAITTTNVNTGPIPFTAACPVITPSGAPAGTYYGLVMYLLPPLEVGDFISITATTSGFAPRIVLIDNETATQYQAVGAGNTVTLNHTITNGAYHYMIITTAAPGFAGTVTTTISGPAARVMTDNAAVRGVPGGMPIPP